MQHDSVDTILEQWLVARPDLDCTPMGVVGRISRIAALIQRELEDVFARHGVSGGEFDVLATLRRSGPPHRLTPSQLSRSTMVTSGGMTKRLDALEAAGLVRREPDPSDRRGSLVVLTPAGLELVDRVVEEHVANEARLLDALGKGERDRLAGLLRKLGASLERS